MFKNNFFVWVLDECLECRVLRLALLFGNHLWTPLSSVRRFCSVSPRRISAWNRVDIIPQIVSFYNYYLHISGDLSVAGNQFSLFYHRITAAAAAAILVVVVVVLVVYENILMVP